MSELGRKAPKGGPRLSQVSGDDIPQVVEEPLVDAEGLAPRSLVGLLRFLPAVKGCGLGCFLDGPWFLRQVWYYVRGDRRSEEFPLSYLE